MITYLGLNSHFWTLYTRTGLKLRNDISISNSSNSRIVGLSRHYTESEAAELRKNNINSISQRPDGTIHLPLGGGNTTDGKGINGARDAIKLMKFAKDLQNDVIGKIYLKINTDRFLGDMTISLEWRGDMATAITDPPRYEIHLPLCIPILT